MTASVIADIGIKVDSDEIKKLQKRTKAANEEFKKTTDSSKKMGSGVAKAAAAFKALGKGTAIVGAIGLAVGKAAYEMGQWTNNIALTNRELDNLARIAGTSAHEVNLLGIATAQFGISGEKALDIVQDFDDKLGDFTANNAGPFVDFFDNVGTKAGLTADALSKMSGTQGLIAVKKALDDSNVSYKEQVFYLESMASDLSKLTPLLIEEGKALSKIQSDLINAGVIITPEQTARLEKYSYQVGILSAQWENFKVVIATFVAPALESLTGKLGSLLTWMRDVSDEQKRLLSIVDLAKRYDEADASLTKLQATYAKLRAEDPDNFFKTDQAEAMLEESAAITSIVNETRKLLELEKERKSLSDAGESAAERAKAEADAVELLALQLENAADKAARFQARRAGNAGIYANDEDLGAGDRLAALEIQFDAERALLEQAALHKQEVANVEIENLRIKEETIAGIKAEYRDKDFALEENQARRKEDLEQTLLDQRANQAQTFFGNMASLSQSGNKKLAAIGKAAAISQATISGFQAIQNALAVQPYPVGVALAASAGILAAGNIAKIAATPLAKGGVLDSPQIVGSVGGNPALAGEAGPEAVLPLQRGADGRLGVSGGASNIDVGGITINGDADQDAVYNGVYQAMEEIAITQIATQNRPGNINNPFTIQNVF